MIVNSTNLQILLILTNFSKTKTDKQISSETVDRQHSYDITTEDHYHSSVRSNSQSLDTEKHKSKLEKDRGDIKMLTGVGDQETLRQDAKLMVEEIQTHIKEKPLHKR